MKSLYRFCIGLFVMLFFFVGNVRSQNKDNDGNDGQHLPVVKPWKIIYQDKDYMGVWTISGDLIGDGKPELACTRTIIVDNYRYTASAIAYTLDNKVLWKWGNPEGFRPSGAESQIYDWDDDGKDEVLFITYKDGKSWMVELDGIDEILTGFVMVDEKGNPIWIANMDRTVGAGVMDCAKLFHQGSVYIVEKIAHPSPHLSKIVLTYCNARRIAMIEGVWNQIWGISGRHFEVDNVGKGSDLYGQQIIVDIQHREDDVEDQMDIGALWILDSNGKKLTVINTHTLTVGIHKVINWFGGNDASILVSANQSLYDGYGNKQAILDTRLLKGADTPQENNVTMAFTGDMTCDGIPDIVLYNNPGAQIYIYKNENGSKPRDKVNLGTGMNYSIHMT